MRSARTCPRAFLLSREPAQRLAPDLPETRPVAERLGAPVRADVRCPHLDMHVLRRVNNASTNGL